MAKDDVDKLAYDSGLIPTQIVVTGAQADAPGSLEILQEYSGEIRSFIQRQRDAKRLSGLEITAGNLSSPQLDISYRNIHGVETVALEPHPDNPPPEHFPPQRPPPPVHDDYTPPTFDQEPIIDYPCLMVIYNGRSPTTGNKAPCVAAFPMAGLSGSTLAPVFTAGLAGSTVAQPCLTAQVAIGGLSIIHTDADLSNQGHTSGSNICTPFLVDSVSLGKKVVPIFNGTGSADTATLFTSAARVTYAAGKFTVAQAPGFGDYQPCAIDTSGVCYFEPVGNTAQITIDTDLSTADDTIASKAIGDGSALVNTYVKTYTVGYVLANDDDSQQSWNASTVVDSSYSSNGFVHVNNYCGVGTDKTQSNDNVKLTAVEQVVPADSDPSTPLQYQNMNLVTVPLGKSYYFQANYFDTMTLPDLKLLYGLSQYYSYSAQDNLYDFRRADGSAKQDITGDFPRMIFANGAAGWGVLLDRYDLMASMEQQIVYPSGQQYQYYPEWGGSLYFGVTTTNQPTTSQPFPPDPNPPSDVNTFNYPYSTIVGEGKISGGSQQQQIVLHSTSTPAGTTANGSYGQVKAAYEAILIDLYKPTCTPNGDPGSTLTGAAGSTTIFQRTQDTTPGGTTTSSGPTTTTSGAIPRAPGLSLGALHTTYTYTLTAFNGQTLNAQNDDFDSNQSAARIDVAIFPPGNATTPFYVLKQLPYGNDQTETAKLVTPYRTFANTVGMVGWMHLSNADHILQGILIEPVATQDDPTPAKVPYIWLDGTDITAPLAKALGCATTDIAACYFDIQLSAVKQVTKVTQSM